MRRGKNRILTEDEGAEIASIWHRLEQSDGGTISYSVMRHKNFHRITKRGNAKKIMRILHGIRHCGDKKLIDIKFNQSKPATSQ